MRWSNIHFTFYIISVDKTQVLHTQRQRNKGTEEVKNIHDGEWNSYTLSHERIFL